MIPCVMFDEVDLAFWKRIAAEEAKHLDEWEKQIERDSNAGKLDHLLAELKDDIRAGRVKPLDEVINAS
jgi:hypothetical protein